MLGFGITLSQITADNERKLLAHWESRPEGTEWILALEREGKAVKTADNGGYPDKFEIRSKEVFPLFPSGKRPQLDDLLQRLSHLGNGQPSLDPTAYGYIAGSGYIVEESVESCPLDAMLEVEVWDQS